MGQAILKYDTLRRILASYLPAGQKLPEIPAPSSVIEIPEIRFTESAPVWDNLPAAIHSPQPKPMEAFGQKGGFILYRTKLVGHKKGKLRITDLHDYATVFVDGKYIGKLDRTKAENIIELPASTAENPQLDILVEGMGRINFAEYMIDRKGITERVSLNGMTLMNWEIFTLPFDEEYLKKLKFTTTNSSHPGNFFKGEFELTSLGDTYIDMSKWDKGVVWINGHNLGRYWNIGPQYQLYCPAPWLKKGKNEIVIFDMHLLESKPVKEVKSME